VEVVELLGDLMLLMKELDQLAVLVLSSSHTQPDKYLKT
jgi:hypothetical protein